MLGMWEVTAVIRVTEYVLNPETNLYETNRYTFLDQIIIDEAFVGIDQSAVMKDAEVYFYDKNYINPTTLIDVILVDAKRW